MLHRPATMRIFMVRPENFLRFDPNLSGFRGRAVAVSEVAVLRVPRRHADQIIVGNLQKIGPGAPVQPLPGKPPGA